MKAFASLFLLATTALWSGCTPSSSQQTIPEETVTTIRLFEGDNPDPSLVRYWIRTTWFTHPLSIHPG